MKLLSIIIPVYKSELNLPTTYKKLTTELSKYADLNYELIFVNDGSPDNSLKYLKELQQQDGSVVVINFTRNFGQVAAILAGLAYAKGDCAINISADLQDPPEMIHELFKAWNNGEYKLVIGERLAREDAWARKFASSFFYKMMQKFALPNLHGAYDFFLVDRVMIDLLTKNYERNPFIQGLLLWPGYAPKLVPYTRQKREIGKSAWSLSKLIKYFIDGFVAYSFFPIRIISVIGLGCFIFSVVLTIALVFQKMFLGTNMAGWSSIMIAILMIGGIQMGMLGIIGEYLWRNFDETRKRPLFIVEFVLKK
jgi:dolichol-phosphate mannosyltransferase